MRLMNKTLSLLIVWMIAIYPFPLNLEPRAMAAEMQQSEIEKQRPPAYSAEEVQKSHDSKARLIKRADELEVINSIMPPEEAEGPEGGEKPIGPPMVVIEPIDKTVGDEKPEVRTRPAPKIVDWYHLPRPEPTDPIGPPGKARVLTDEGTEMIGPPGKARVLTDEGTAPIGPPGKAKVLTAEDTKPIGPPGIGAVVTATYELIPLPQGEGIDDRTGEAVGHGPDPRARRDNKDEEEWINKSKRKPAL